MKIVEALELILYFLIIFVTIFYHSLLFAADTSHIDDFREQCIKENKQFIQTDRSIMCLTDKEYQAFINRELKR